MVARLPRTSATIVSNFRNNLQSIEKFKELNVFVKDTIVSAEKKVDEITREGTVLNNIHGLTFAVKDNLCTKGISTSCSSKMLKDYSPPYSATVVRLLEESGAVMLGKTNMDEFGMGSSTLYSSHGPTINPWSSHVTRRWNWEMNEEQREDWIVCGGSSGGSAAAVASGMCDFALGSDTGGSTRLPASFCGIAGLKPTYGRLSRHGLIPLASSMDTVGILASTVHTIACVLDVISGFDTRDSTSVKREYDSCSKDVETDNLNELLNGIKIGIPKDIDVPELDSQYRSKWLSVADKLAHQGSQVIDVSLPHFKYGVPCYNVVNCAEVVSNMAKYTGLIFGKTIDSKNAETVNQLFTLNRIAGLGSVVQHRIIAGMYFLSYQHHYEKALRVRQMIHSDFESVFQEDTQTPVDLLLTPVTLSSAPYQSTMRNMGPVESSIYDTYTVPVNLSGVPAISVPIGLCGKGLPLGIQVIGKWMDERNMLRMARAIELICNN